VLELREIPEGSANLAHLKCLAEQNGLFWKQEEVACGTVRLPESWDEYLQMLRPRFRTKIRSALRNLEPRPEVRFGFCETEAQVEAVLPALYDLHTRRWALGSMPGVFGWEAKRRFYAALSPLLLERGWLRLSWLEWNQRILACQYGFAYGGTYFHLQEGYEPASDHWNLGLALRAWTIRQFQKEGIREYDFLGGMGRHKTDWGAEVKKSTHILLARATRGNIRFCRGAEWETRAREAIRTIVPEPILKMRRARAAFRQPAEIAPAGACPGAPGRTEGARKLMAECYLGLQLPKLVSSLSDRYQLSVSANGLLPKIRWTRRREPCGRILYYHRVNDDGDPFFPAMSTRLFAQEIAFVARHYRVVGLRTLLETLEEDARPRNLMAITFDDGYQDNFHNAFPILQRYGVPATIFLTTGNLDSREPMWFEDLAWALKRTTRDYLDLEIDLPRRVWLRTEAERLAGHRQIFGILRALPDRDRLERLAEVLRLLAAGDNPRKGKMLTWDQVRRMRAGGIEFGSHTVSHPFLSKLSREQACREVSESKRRIEEELQDQVDYFAYPNGLAEDFSDWNQELIRAAGYRAAVTSLWGLNFRSTDRMALRRGQPWEEDRAVFASKLDWYQLTNG